MIEANIQWVITNAGVARLTMEHVGEISDEGQPLWVVAPPGTQQSTEIEFLRRIQLAEAPALKNIFLVFQRVNNIKMTLIRDVLIVYVHCYITIKDLFEITDYLKKIGTPYSISDDDRNEISWMGHASEDAN